jgi:hypothetical protein
MSLEQSRPLAAPSALPQRNAAPRVIRTSKADEGPASAGEFWAVVRAASLVVLVILALGYIMG